MSEKCYINTQYRNKRQINAETDRAYCGFHISKGGFAKPVTITVFGTRPKGVLS
jgi:hypothetical protein